MWPLREENTEANSELGVSVPRKDPHSGLCENPLTHMHRSKFWCRYYTEFLPCSFTVSMNQKPQHNTFKIVSIPSLHKYTRAYAKHVVPSSDSKHFQKFVF